MTRFVKGYFKNHVDYLKKANIYVLPMTATVHDLDLSITVNTVYKY